MRQPATDRLPVLIDVGPAVHQRAGLSRYTTALVEALHNHADDDLDIQLYFNRHSGHDLPSALANLPATTLNQSQLLWRLSVLASRLLRVNYRPLCRTVAGRAVYHACEHLLPQLPIATVLTVHDLIFEHYPQHHTRANRAFLRLAMPLFTRGATRIITVSRTTADDLESLYNIPRDKINVVYEGVDEHFHPANEETVRAIRARYSPDRPYLFMVGTLEPRKNHRLALEALARLKALGYPHRLLIAGGHGWLFAPIQAHVAALGLEGDVTFTGYVPGADLPGLYTAADCVLVPSLYEGFGLPVLEAMACAAPVVCSNTGSLPEIAGDAARLISPTDASALVAAVRQLLDTPDQAAELRRRGPAHARRFTWQAAALQTVQVYHHAADCFTRS